MAAQESGLLPPEPEGDPGERSAGALPALEPAEISRRLDTSTWELGNRRKILIRNLPPDCCGQDIHDLLKDYAIKYCYVDKNKKTAFITLSNGEQAQEAIHKFHKHLLRDKEISVQLQPTDALLCITNLPPLFSMQEFEELVRTYGNIERCLLAYSEQTGHSKGYGFVEYMKKDSASKARLELLGKQMGKFTLFAQWIDVNQLTADFIHSKCLCVDKIPKDYANSDELTQLFSTVHKPLFCQLANDESGLAGGFAIVEYETAEQAEEVRNATDGMVIKDTRVQVSFCAPGSPGRSVLAALIAAQGMLQNNRKGLLPEPNPVQIMQSLNNPAMVQMLLQPQSRGRSGKHASSVRPHYVNPTVSQALLQLNKLHQKPALAGNLLLQNYSPLQMAQQQQLLQLKSVQSNNSKPGLLGEAPISILQTTMGTVHAGPVETAQRDIPKNLMPYYHSQHLVPSLSRTAQDKASPSLASDGSLLTGQNPAHSQASTTDPLQRNKPNAQTSLLGEPPRDIRLSTNPYLNLASVLPGTSMTGLAGRTLQPHVMDGLISQDCTAQPGLDYITYSQPQCGDYSQEALQQWYDYYASYGSAQTDVTADTSQEQRAADSYQASEEEDYYYQSPSSASYRDYSAYEYNAPPTYYVTTQGSYQTAATPPSEKVTSTDKRAYIVSAGETRKTSYAEASGESYSDAYFKRKKVY